MALARIIEREQELELERVRKEGQKLFKASIKGDIKAVKDCLEGNKGNTDVINFVSERDYTTPLMEAASHDRLPVLQALLEAGANVDAAGGLYDQTALIYAVTKGHFRIVRALLNASADVDYHDDCGWTALMYAADSGQGEMIRDLIRKNADVTLRNREQKTAEQIAVSRGYQEIATFLQAAARQKLAPEIKGEAPSAAHLSDGEKDKKIADLTRKTEDLTKRLEKLELLVANLTNNNSRSANPSSFFSRAEEQKASPQPSTTSKNAAEVMDFESSPKVGGPGG